MIGQWLQAFALTVGVESAIAVPLLRAADDRLWRRVALVFFANLASHPAVWFIFPRMGASYAVALLASETWAVAIEAVFYLVTLPEASRARLLGVAMIANGASWGVGEVLHATTGW